MKILIMKFRHIGDVVLSTPLIKNLHDHYPNAKIDYALNLDSKDIIENNPYINTVFPYNRKFVNSHNRLKKIFLEYQYAKDIFKNEYDIIINLTEGDRGAQIALLCKAPIKLGIKPKKGILSAIKIFDHCLINCKSTHAVEKDLKFLEFLAKKPLSKKVEVFWTKESEKVIDTILTNNNIKNFVVIHPTAKLLFKCWDNQKFAKIIDYLQIEKNISVIITAGNGKHEIDKVDAILTKTVSKPLNLSAKINLKELAYLYSKAKMYIGIDTAPMHIAAAVNTKVFALFGPTEAIEWGPWDNDIQKSEYLDAYESQKNGKHFVIQANQQEYYTYKKNKKLSPPQMVIDENEMIKILDNYEF